MDRNEVLERLDRMAEEANIDLARFESVGHWPAAVEKRKQEQALRATAEIIRESGWRPIAEVEPGEVIFAGKWNDRDEWQECWPIVADVAVSFGYTHHWPQMKKPAPPAREVENG